MRRIGIGIAAALLILTLAAPAQAWWSVAGGRILPKGDDAVRAWVGFPSIGVALQTPINRRIELGGYASFTYGTSHGVAVPQIGIMGGGLLKINLLESGSFALAFQADPGLRFNFHEEFLFGLRLGPRVVGSWDVASQVSVLFRGGVPMEMLFAPEFAFYMPIALGAGVEFAIHDDFNIVFTSDVGPMFYTRSGTKKDTGLTDNRDGDGVDFYYRGEVGIAYRF